MGRLVVPKKRFGVIDQSQIRGWLPAEEPVREPGRVGSRDPAEGRRQHLLPKDEPVAQLIGEWWDLTVRRRGFGWLQALEELHGT
eukprot:scaffold42251_cov185-Isochrysis_galbana.AAC.1